MATVVNYLLSNTDSSSPSVLLSLDISAAFDTLQHTRLLQHAENLFGLTGKTKEWLSSYLTKRSSYVLVGDQRSSSVSSSTGVLQGSVLGLLLFSIFPAAVDKLVTSLSIHVSCHQYDTQLYTTLDKSSTYCMSFISFCADSCHYVVPWEWSTSKPNKNWSISDWNPPSGPNCQPVCQTVCRW